MDFLAFVENMDRNILRTFLLHLMLWFSNITHSGPSKYLVDADGLGIMKYPERSSSMFGNAKYIKNILVDEKNNRVTIAPMNYLVQLDMKSLKILHTVYLPPDKESMDDCVVGSKKELCQNFMKVLLLDPNGNIFACGTNSGSPKCWQFQRTTLEILPKLNISGIGRCPSNPKENISSLFHDGYLFSATNLGSKRYAIFKAKVSNNISPVRTLNVDVVFNVPRFVSSYYLGSGFVYFFFREVAIENSERKVVYSRVARVCQFDRGELILLEDKFTSFLKSQLICVDNRGSVPTYFDELQNTFLLDVHTTSGVELFVYGVFTTSSEMLGSSAVCRYKVKDIEKLFESSSYAEKTNDGRWISVTHPSDYPDAGKPNCTKTLDTTKYDYRSANFAIRHPLLYNDVLPYDGQAIVLMPGISLTSLAVSDVHFSPDDSDIGIHVIFAGSTDGNIYKVMVNSSNQGSPHVIEKIKPFKVAQPITTMEMSKDAIFVGTPSSGVARVALTRCDQYVLCSDCIRSRDPFCAWDRDKSQCVSSVTLAKSKRLQDLRHGDTSICPPVSTEISCKVQVLESYPGAKTALECNAKGLPSPSIIAWTKEDSKITMDGQRYRLRKISDVRQQLIIQNYTLEEVGKYSCIIARGKSRASCLSVLTGSEPILNCSRSGQRCHCSVAGVPLPKITKIVAGKLLGVQGTTFSLPSGVTLFAVSAFGQAGFTCEIPTEQPTLPATSATTTTATTSSTTITPTTSAPTTTHAPTAVPVARRACPGCACVSYLTPLIAVSVLFVIMTILCGALIALLFFMRIRRYSVDDDAEFSHDSDHVDGKRDIYIVKFSRKNSRKQTKKRNEAVRNESRKALIRSSSNDSNPVYKNTVIEMNHKNDKGGATGNHHNSKNSKT